MSATRIRRIGVLTGGGDCPGLNAVIRAVVKTAITTYGWEVIGIEDGFEGLLVDNKTRRLTEEDVRGILPRGGTILGTTNRGNPFAYRVQEGGRVRVEDRSAQAIQRLSDLAIDALVVIGGDGSLSIARDFAKLGVRLVGVPKTIDNDISGTDVTFGFDTALNIATEAIDRLHTTAESHHRVMVLEVMGRNAGWIALEAGIAGGGDIILVPEIPFSPEAVARHIGHRDARGRNFSIVVVAEGAIPAGGSQFYLQDGESCQPGRLGGVGNWLASELARMVPHEVRAVVLGHLQRGGSPSSFDRVLATRLGSAAVTLLAEGAFGRMAALHGNSIESVPIEEAVGNLKRVAPDSQLVSTARKLGISFGD